MKFYTADPHFSHRNIINYAQRPFASVDEMNAFILDFYYDTIQDLREGDTFYVLGDLSFKPEALLKSSDFLEVFSRPAQTVFVSGNHDKVSSLRELYLKAFGNIVGDEKTWKNHSLIVEDTVQDRAVRVLLSHEPQKDLKGCDFNLYGHHHNNISREIIRPDRRSGGVENKFREGSSFANEYSWLINSSKHFNVGVELTGYKPRTLDELITMREELGLLFY